jgi:hypothetical protein
MDLNTKNSVECPACFQLQYPFFGLKILIGIGAVGDA